MGMLLGGRVVLGPGVSCMRTLHLQDLPNYETGGTIHLVVNNQVWPSPRCCDHCPILTQLLHLDWNCFKFHCRGSKLVVWWALCGAGGLYNRPKVKPLVGVLHGRGQGAELPHLPRERGS